MYLFFFLYAIIDIGMEIKINMNNVIELEVFKKAIFNFQRLEKYGFKKENDIYKLVKTILNDKFKVIIEIGKSGTVIGKIFDIKTNDEYSNFRGDTLGDFSSKVKSEYLAILNDIKNKYCDITYFCEAQSNRVCNYIIDKFKINPEFLWEKFPGYGVFRNKDNNKWFAVILNINKSKFDGEDKEVEVINVKVNPNNIEELLKRNNYYEGYHMNKKHWVSIILDDKVLDKEIFELVNEAYNLLIKK